MHTELISVILCTRDINCLEDSVMSSIKSQTYVHRELIIEEGIGNNNKMRNSGFDKSKGDFIFFMDEDVILRKDCLLVMYDNLIRCEVDFVYCNYDRTGFLSGIHQAKQFDVKKLRTMNYISTMSLMKRRLFPSFDTKIERLQDWDLFLTITERGGVGAHIDECLFTAMYNNDCISGRGSEDWFKSVDIVKKKHNIIS